MYVVNDRLDISIFAALLLHEPVQCASHLVVLQSRFHSQEVLGLRHWAVERMLALNLDCQQKVEHTRAAHLQNRKTVSLWTPKS